MSSQVSIKNGGEALFYVHSSRFFGKDSSIKREHNGFTNIEEIFVLYFIRDWRSDNRLDSDHSKLLGYLWTHHYNECDHRCI